MSARSSLICSAVELWYKKMLKIGSLSELTGMGIKIKVAGFQRLYSKWLWLLMAVYKPSFAYTKLGKYGSKYFVSRDLTCDFSEVVHAFSNVLGEEVSGEAGL